MKLQKLTYKKVFNTRDESFSHKVDQCSFHIYKTIRLKLSKVLPLKEHEAYFLNDQNHDERFSSPMPNGFDYTTSKEVEGFVTLKYVDLFDYLPKEDIDSFRKQLHHFVKTNKRPSFSPAFFERDEERIINMGRYFDGYAFANLCMVEFKHNSFLSVNDSRVMVSIHNLSSSFALIRYRLYVTKEFSTEIEGCLNKKYAPYNDVCRQYDTPWYKPWKFGISCYSGDDARQKAFFSNLYKLIWELYSELKHCFTVHFSESTLFPPVFFTYSTNIRPDSKQFNLDFWKSIGLDSIPDYSQKYNLCVSSFHDRNNRRGTEMLALCGGKYTQNDFYPDLAEYHLPDYYCVYMVANAIRMVAERDIANLNIRISRAIRSGKTARLLRVRSAVERKTYYSYRFLQEFSGDTIDKEAFADFHNPALKEGSISAKLMLNTPSLLAETKTKIDNILQLLNDAAEFHLSKSNMALQWAMVIITILSLLIAGASLLASYNNFGEAIKSVFKLFPLVRNSLY